MILLTDADIRRVIKDTNHMPLNDSYIALCKAQLVKIAHLLATGTTKEEIIKEAKL